MTNFARPWWLRFSKSIWFWFVNETCANTNCIRRQQWQHTWCVPMIFKIFVAKKFLFPTNMTSQTTSRADCIDWYTFDAFLYGTLYPFVTSLRFSSVLFFILRFTFINTIYARVYVRQKFESQNFFTFFRHFAFVPIFFAFFFDNEKYAVLRGQWFKLE